MSPPQPLLGADTAVLGPFVAAGVLDAASVHVAATIARAAGGIHPEVLLAVALTARAPQHGHVCMVPADVARSVTVDERAAGEPTVDVPVADALAWPEVGGWIERIVTSPAVRSETASADGELTPLVWDGERLYLERYWRHEQSVARALADRTAGAVTGLFGPGPDLDDLLDRHFAPDRDDAQRRAGALALTRRLAVIAGGPGTGKTRTVARLVTVARELADRSGRNVEIALTAPTGKAAARMSEAIAHETEAITVHRLLGAMGGLRFRHDRRNPLPHDLVVVDEASMVSLPLMARLLEALRPHAGLVLVGDPDQLASIEAGAVLGEITGAAHAEPVAGHVVTLDRVHRFDAGSDIAMLADAVRSGDADAVMAALHDGVAPAVRWVEPSDEVARAEVEAALAADAAQVVRAARAGEAHRAVDLLPASKVLTATRHGLLGAYRWRSRIEALVAELVPGADLTRRWYVGRPVLVTRNDPLNRLVNGDVGLVVAGERPQVLFPGPGGELRSFAPSQLADIETWWSMTIHKSQGSEFERVVISLPEPPSPVLSRELLYTAVTRAEQQVTIVASEASIREAVEHRVARASGLGARLRPR
jgi:exodeoxyribonuclease V alpha subunit